MTKLSLRIYMLLCLLAMKIRLWAQDDDDDIFGRSTPSGDPSLDLEDMDYAPMFHITFTDVVLIVILLLACYVFGKIWKGCTYLLLLFAALLYYVSRY